MCIHGSFTLTALIKWIQYQQTPTCFIQERGENIMIFSIFKNRAVQWPINLITTGHISHWFKRSRTIQNIKYCAFNCSTPARIIAWFDFHPQLKLNLFHVELRPHFSTGLKNNAKFVWLPMCVFVINIFTYT